MQEMKSAVEKLSMPFLRTESRRRARSIGMRAYAPKAAEAAIRATARSGRSRDAICLFPYLNLIRYISQTARYRHNL